MVESLIGDRFKSGGHSLMTSLMHCTGAQVSMVSIYGEGGRPPPLRGGILFLRAFSRSKKIALILEERAVEI